MTGRTALVTGAAGFIGSHLSERLLGDGWRVIGVDAFTPYYERAAKEANVAAALADPRFELLELDVAAADLVAAAREADVVFHLAAQPGVRGSFGAEFARYTHDNLLGTQRVLEAARDARCRRVVWASSSSVYGDAETYPCRERETPTRPRSPYGVTKRACEDLAEVYRGLGLETVGLRYFTVYGPRQRPDMAIRRLCEAAAGGAPFTLNGDGAQSRDFTHVSDAVDATIRAALAPDPHAILNVGGGEEATLAAVIAALEELTGARMPLRRAPDQTGDVRRTSADTTRARVTLGWNPRVGLRAGLESELEWVRGRRQAAPGRAAA
jgi:UDP-glucose 4-epimerase